MTTISENQMSGKLAWVEPEVLSLEVADTELFVNRGSDGGRFNVDSSKS